MQTCCVTGAASMKKDKTRRLTLTAVFTAFSVGFMYLSSVFPTGQLGFLGISSLFGIAAVIEYRIAGGIFVFAATALIGLLIVPDKMLVLLYSMFFGYYPILKSLAEKTKSRIIEWLIKLVVFNVALTLILFVFKLVLFDFSFLRNSYFLLYLFCNIVFILFDIGVSRVIIFYISKISSKIH